MLLSRAHCEPPPPQVTRANSAARGHRHFGAIGPPCPRHGLLGPVRTEAARDRDELRVDLRVRAERQAGAYRDELGQLPPPARQTDSTGNGSAPAAARNKLRSARTSAT